MPEMIPVGNTGTPPNPQQSLSTLSGLLGVQQQRQQLQTGQYLQAGAQAESQQAGQKNQELQGLAQFSANAVKDPKYLNEDGSLNVQKFQQDALAVAPVYGPPSIGQITSNAQEGAQIRRTLQALSKDQNAVLVNGLKGLANMPGGATKSDVLNWTDQVESNNKDPGIHRAIKNLLIGMHPDENGGYSGFAAKAAAGLGGLSMQEPGQMALVGAVQPGTTTTLGPNVGQFSATGAPVPTVTPATNTTNAAGQIIHIPTGGAGLPSTGTAGNPTTPQVSYAQSQAQGIGTRQNVANEQANQSPQALDALSRARAILDKGTWTGTEFSGFRALKNALAGVGIKTEGATNANELVKNLARYEATRANGVGNTDAARSLFETGSPNTKVDAEAAKNIITQAMGN